MGTLLRGQVASLARVVTVDDLREHAARPTPRPRHGQGHRVHPVHLGLHRQPEGRGAHARQPARQRPRDGARHRRDRRGRVRELAAALSRHGADRRVALPALRRPAARGDVAARLPGAARALAVGDPPLSRHDLRGPNFAYELWPRGSTSASSRGSTSRRGAGVQRRRAGERRHDGALRRALRALRLRRAALAPVYGLAECALGLAFPPRAARRARRPRATANGSPPTASRAPAAADDDARGGDRRLRPARCPATRSASSTRPSRELPERHEGRLEFQGPSATSGYYRNPEATAELFDGDWLDTGDLGYIAEGELYLTGRAKDMIIRGGQQRLSLRARGGGRQRAGHPQGLRRGVRRPRPGDRHRAPGGARRDARDRRCEAHRAAPRGSTSSPSS